MASAAVDADDSVAASAEGAGGGVVWYAWGSGGTGVLMHGYCDDVHAPTQVKVPLCVSIVVLPFGGASHIACTWCALRTQ